MAATTKTWIDNSAPTLNDDDLNGFKDEGNNLIVGSGQTLSTSDNQQTHKAVSVYAAVGDFYTESGAADAYVLSVSGARVAPASYLTGMRVRFTTGNANTGPSTINVDGIGVKSIIDDQTGLALTAGAVSATAISIAYYDGTDFRLIGARPNLIDEIVVSGGAVTQIDFTGLDINTHKGYRIEIENINATALDTGVDMFVNGDVTQTNYYTQTLQSEGAVTTSAQLNNGGFCGARASVSSYTVANLALVDGVPSASFIKQNGSGATVLNSSGAWSKTATVTNITQLTFVAGAANALDNGTRIRIYREDV